MATIESRKPLADRLRASDAPPDDEAADRAIVYRFVPCAGIGYCGRAPRETGDHSERCIYGRGLDVNWLLDLAAAVRTEERERR